MKNTITTGRVIRLLNGDLIRIDDVTNDGIVHFTQLEDGKGVAMNAFGSGEIVAMSKETA